MASVKKSGESMRTIVQVVKKVDDSFEVQREQPAGSGTFTAYGKPFTSDQFDEAVDYAMKKSQQENSAAPNSPQVVFVIP